MQTLQYIDSNRRLMCIMYKFSNHGRYHYSVPFADPLFFVRRCTLRATNLNISPYHFIGTPHNVHDTEEKWFCSTSTAMARLQYRYVLLNYYLHIEDVRKVAKIYNDFDTKYILDSYINIATRWERQTFHFPYGIKYNDRIIFWNRVRRENWNFF